ncbi:MAG: CARDB domain-containing protein, partial [Thermoplasmata archaeon]
MEKNVIRKLVCLAVLASMLMPGTQMMFMYVANVSAEISQDEYGNLVINGTSVFEINSLTVDPLTGEHGMYGMRGNITVTDGGTLLIRDAKLYFLQDELHHYWLNISNNGRIIMENGSITVSTNQILPYVFFNISMINAGDSYINKSNISYPGYFNVQNTNLTVINSTFSPITPPFTDPLLIDQTDDSPVLRATNSRVVFINSRIEKCYENAYANATYVLRPLYRAVDDNTSNLNTAPLNFTDGNYYNISAGQLMHVQKFDTQGNTGNVLNAWLEVTYKTDLDYNSPTVIQISYDGGTTWQDTTIAPLNRTTSITETYTIGTTTFGNLSNMEVRYENQNGTLNVSIDKLVVYAQVYIGINERDQYDIIFNNTTLIAIDSYIDADFLSSMNTESMIDNSNPQHNRIVLRNGSYGYLINLTVNEVQSPQHEDTPFITDATSEIYLYRWVDVNVKDAQNLPVSGASINVSYNGPTGAIADRVKILNDMNTAPYAPYVLSYIGRTLSNYNVTNASGRCSIPLVTDNISIAFWPNSMPYGNYRANLTYTGVNGTINMYSNFSFPAFPLINETTNRKVLNFTFGVVIEHPDLQIKFTETPRSMITVNSLLELNVSITNGGTANATHFRVVFFEGHPAAGGKIFASVNLQALGVGETVNLPSQYWSTSTAGKYKIVVVVDYDNEVYEQNENNNTLIHNLVVYREGADLFIDGTPLHPNRTFKDISQYIHSGFIIVKGEGNLTLDNTTLNVSQVYDYQYGIIIEENGSLFLTNNAKIVQSRGLAITLSGNATLAGRYANFTNLTITSMGNSIIDLKDTEVNGCMLALNSKQINLENASLSLKQQAGSVYLNEDFEGETSAWTNISQGNAIGNWEAGNPKVISPHSGNVSFGTELLDKDGDGKYANSSTYTLISPEISLLDAPTAVLTFYHYYRIADDIAYVEITVDGENWYEIANYTGSVSTWTKVSIDITQYAGNIVKIRFRLVTNSSLNDIGWYLDDITVSQRFDIHANQLYGKDIKIDTGLTELSGYDICTLINATLPENRSAVVARDNAQAMIYRYLVVNALDANSQPVSGVGVYVYGYANGTLVVSGNTDTQGRVMLTLLTDIINATTYESSYFVGMYSVNVSIGTETHWYNIFFAPYPSWMNILTLNVTLTTPLPDLTVGIAEMQSQVPAGSTIAVTVVVNNTGTSTAANAEIVLYDITDTNTTLIGKQTVNVSGNTYWQNLTFNWMPGTPGKHRILAIADPLDNITELNETNNQFWVEVLVYRPGVDLLIVNTTITLRNMNYQCSGFVYM